MMSPLDRLCAKKNVRIESKLTDARPDWDTERWDGTSWSCTLRIDRRRMTVPFFQGAAHTREPSAADVLSCLCSDAFSIQNASDFEDWCGDLGYDTDSRKAERTFKACERIAVKLRRFLGDDFDAFCQAEH